MPQSYPHNTPSTLKSPHISPAQAATATSAPSEGLSTSDYIRCISREGEEFILHRDCAKVSRLLAQQITKPQGGPPPLPKDVSYTANDQDFAVPLIKMNFSEGLGSKILQEPFKLPPDTKWDDYFNPANGVSEADRQDIIRSLTIFPYIAPSFTAPIQTTVRLPCSSALLEIVIRYLHYHHRYEKEPEGRPQFEVPPEMALDLISVATLLQC
eukprot:GILI01017551.1.p1 GENE.GILI01017551.1~~GILI01017551.1.p1  ORF type:complete len:212 (+),score=29.44 GILI01017551.1:56-691(+)